MWSAPFAEKAVEYVSGAVELATVVRNFQRRLSRFTRNPTVKAAKARLLLLVAQQQRFGVI
jgi:hypothetical protein